MFFGLSGMLIASLRETTGPSSTCKARPRRLGYDKLLGGHHESQQRLQTKQPNKALHLTASSVRSYVASASGAGER